MCAGECEAGSEDWDSSCEAYRPVLNAEGRNVVIGAVSFEGYFTGASARLLAAVPAAVACMFIWKHRMRAVAHEQSCTVCRPGRQAFCKDEPAA